MKDQSAKLEVLQKIIEMMDSLDAEKLKKPDVAVIDVKADAAPVASEEAAPVEAAEKPVGDEDDDELMAKLHEMYSKVK